MHGTHVLCNAGKDSHNHLFYECPYSQSILLPVKGRNQILVPQCRLEEINSRFLLNVKGQSFECWLGNAL